MLNFLANNDIRMEGDHEVRDVPVDRFYIDAACGHWKDANHCIEEREVPLEKALSQFTGEEIQEYIKGQYKKARTDYDVTGGPKNPRNTVTLYEYYERGRPWNGFLGLHVIFMDPLEPKILFRGPNPYKHRRLPYSVYTDIDVPSNPYGMSRIVYAYQVQKCIDSLISMVMDNIHLHGSSRMMYPEGSLTPENVQNAADWAIPFNASTGGKPEWFRPANVTTDVWKGYDILRAYINNIYGMNEFSQGQIPRELSSYAVQLALEMDDKYRIRLFNTKKAFLRDIYDMGLENTKQFMTDSRKLRVTGVEGRSDSIYFSASDLVGEYDIDVDYGQYIPVDPAAKKQQLLDFIKTGFYEKAGGNMKKIASLLIDGSMLDARDSAENSAKCQAREIDKMIAGEPVDLNEWDKDEQHISEIDSFTDTETFSLLPREIQDHIWSHGVAHTNRLAQKMAAAQGGAPGAGAPPPGGAGGPAGTPPMPPEETEKPKKPRVTPFADTQPTTPMF
jgi:hypothetical protein